MSTTLFYIHDPMCSWCWAFRPVYNAMVTNLPENITLKRLLGGLAPDTSEPMPEEMQNYVKNHWRTIQKKVFGTEFNFDFWEKCQPRRSTYPACRAVISARMQGDEFDDKMTLAIQQGYYLKALNPSDDDTLIRFASETGLDVEQFSQDLKSPETNAILRQEIDLAVQLGVTGFPSLLLENMGKYVLIPINYSNAVTILNAIQNSI